jgi:iron complex outermembrane receptor protein
MSRSILNGVCLAAIASAALSGQAFAQTAAGATGASGGVTELEDIIVTASRRAETAQRAALSIQAVSGADLASKGVVRIEDLQSVAPGVTLGSAGNYPQTYVRGVGSFAANAFAENAVATNLDGVYISRPWAARGVFFDLDRVEVLKGPQGTLYGRNASGGALNLISVRPKIGDYSGFIEGEVGSYDLIRVAGAVNLPLSDTLAARVSAQTVNRDGYFSDGSDDEDSQSVRAQLLFVPNEDVSLLLRALYQKNGGRGSGAAVVSPNLGGDPWRSNSDARARAIYAADPLGPFLRQPAADTRLDLTSYELSAELQWDLGPATLTVIPAYRESELDDLTYVPGYRVQNHEQARQYSVEGRLSNETDRLKWVVGAYYFRETQRPTAGNANLDVDFGLGSVMIGPPFNGRTESAAAFGQATYSLTEALRLTGGLRYTYEKKNTSLFSPSYQLAFGPCAPPYAFTPTPPYPGQNCVFSFFQRDQRSFNNTSWKAGLEYDIRPESMAYFNVSTGFKSGGFFPAPSPIGTFDAEKLLAFEGGVKNRFLDNRLQVNLEVFHWQYKDQQTSALYALSNGYITQATFNAGRAKITGADLDVVYRFTSNDTFSFKAEYIHTKYDDYNYVQFAPGDTGCATSGPTLPAVVDCAGKPLIRTPKWSGTAAYTHTFDLTNGATLDATVDTQFASSSIMGNDYLPGQRQDPYSIWNASLTYRTENGVSVTGYVRNIGDEPVITQAFRHAFISNSSVNPLSGPGGLITATLRPPRTYGVTVRAPF